MPQVVRDAPPHTRDVTFDDVSFSYDARAAGLGAGLGVGVGLGIGVGVGAGVHGLTLRIPPGGRLGLVGPSGSGKSTVTRLLTRLFEAQQGKVTVCGCDVRRATQASLRSVISCVAQARRPPHYLLLTTYCLLLTAYCLLTTYGALLTAYY